MKDTLITEILRPAYAVLDKYAKDVNGERWRGEQIILADVSEAVDTIRDDLDKLFTDMLGEDDDSYDYGSGALERDETNNVPHGGVHEGGGGGDTQEGNGIQVRLYNYYVYD
mgnify:CR=1 FL=1